MTDTSVIVLAAIDSLAEKAELKRVAARLRQRRWREGKCRIDYYPNARAAEIVDSLRSGSAGGDASSIINAALERWGKGR